MRRAADLREIKRPNITCSLSSAVVILSFVLVGPFKADFIFPKIIWKLDNKECLSMYL